MQRWSYLDIVTAMHCKQISKLAAKLLNSAPGLSPFLSVYKRACSKVAKNLPKSLCQRYHMIAKEWSDKVLPPRIQQQYAHRTDSSRLELTYFFAIA